MGKGESREEIDGTYNARVLEVRMKQPAARLDVVLVLLLVIVMAHCGGGQSRHDLMSITVSPSSATAVSPNGMVQFTAIGHFSSAPTTQNIAANWSAEPPFSSINSNGLATCLMPSNPPGAPLGIQASSSGNANGDALFGTIEGNASLICQ